MTYFTVILEIIHQPIWNCIIVNQLIRKHIRHLNEHVIYYNFIISYWTKFLKLIKFITQSCMSLLNSFLQLVLNTFSVFLKSLSDYFFSWIAYKSLLNRFSVLINYTVLCGLPNFFLYPAVSHAFHGPGFSGSSFFRVQVQCVGPGFISSNLITLSCPYYMEYLRGWLHIHFHPRVKLNNNM